MLINYENLTSKKDSAQSSQLEANKDLKQGWIRKNYPPLFLDKPIDWTLKSEQERSWNFHIHSWGMLENLLTATSYQMKVEYLQPAIDIALDWCEKNIDESFCPIYSISKFAWYDMAVGLRAYRLAYILDAGRHESILSSNQEDFLWLSLLAHFEYLKDDNNIAFHTNHGYYQAAGQIAMGRRFKNRSIEMEAALAQGTERFKRMLDQQFTAEGVHREHSPDYHRMVYDTLVGVIQSGLINDEYIIQLTYKIEKALSWFVLPDGHIANFGDSDWRLMRRKPSTAMVKWQTEEMRFVVTNGAIGKLDSNRLKAFVEAGYYIVRSKNTMKESDGQAYDTYSYLAQTAAFHSRTHKHADDLSFIWYENNYNILIDAGRFGYIGKTEMGSELWQQGYWYSHPNRLYCESTRAHNTLEFDAANYTRKGAKPYGSAISRHREYTNGLVVLETECKHFKSIRRVRVLIYMPNQWLIVCDWFKDNLNKLHNIRQWFNFAPEISLTKVGEAYQAQLDDDKQLSVTNLLNETVASSIKHGVSEPRQQGWFSPAEREFVPIDSINYKLERVNSGAIATLFSFNGSVAMNISANSVSRSGRQLKVNWQDNQGAHTIHLAREKEQQISVQYHINRPRLPYTFNPYEENGIKEQVRLVIFDYKAKSYVHFAIIKPMSSYQLEENRIVNPENHKHKYQIRNPNQGGNEWIDTEKGYQNLPKIKKTGR